MADETSIWKKELSLGRKRKAPKDEVAPPTPKRPAAESSKTSLWKKELSFGKKKPPAEAVEEPVVADEAPTQVVETPFALVAPTPPVVPTPRVVPSPPVAPRLEQERLVPARAASVHPLPPPSPRLTVEPEPPKAAGQDEQRPRTHLHPVESSPVLHELPAPHEPPAPPVALPGIHAPVPAAELPDPPQAPKTPFWKKELSLKIAAKQPKEPKQVKEPKQPKRVKEPKQPKQLKEPKQPKETRANNTPFWKKDLSLKRNPKPQIGSDEAPAVEAKPAKTPFWKKDLSLKRPTKAERQAKAKRAKNERRPPVWKREVSLRKQKLRGLAPKPGQNLKLVGLKVGASQVAAARVHNNGVPELVQIAREDLQPGIVVGGELRDSDALAVALKTFFRKNKLPKRGVRLGIANNRIGVRTFDVVGIEDPRQLDNAVRFRAQEALPIPIDEAVLDYQILSEFVDEEGQPVKRILLVVAYRELIDRYVAACKKAGIRLMGIDLEAFALLRSISAPRRDADHEGAVVAVAIGSERSTFAVSDGVSCQFTRVLDWGGATLDVAVARALDLTPSQAEPFKRRLSLEPGASDPEGVSPEKAEKARQAVRAQLQAFARELVSSLQFYQNQPESLGIGEIVVTGGTAHLPGLAGELQRLIGVLVRVGDPLGRVQVGKKIDEGDQIGSLAIAIGLGIED